MRSTKYTSQVLGPIVASSRTYSEVLRKLGLSVTGGNHRLIAARIRQWQLDTSHFRYGQTASRFGELPIDELTELVRTSGSFAQILTCLNLPTQGRPHHELKKRVNALGLDTSHFHGQAWARGHTRTSHASLDAGTRK
jgi:hypothetical protein